MNIEEAARSGHPIGLCRALTHSMRLYFWVDDLEQVERGLAKLEYTAERNSLAPARAVALGLRGQYLVRIGRMADGIRHLQESLEKLAVLRYDVVTSDLVSELTVSLAKQNARSEALALIDRSIAAVITPTGSLRLPALFLAKGLALASRGSARESLGRGVFRESDDAGGATISAAVRIACWIGARAYLDRARPGAERP